MVEFITFISQIIPHFNWVDLIILAVIFFYGLEGYSLGFYPALLDLIAFIAAFLTGLSFYNFLAKFLIVYLNLSPGISNAIGFFVIAFITEIVVSYLLKILLIDTVFFEKSDQKEKTERMINNLLGIIPSVLSAVVLITFILALIITLPLSTFLKTSVAESKMGGRFVTNTQWLSKNINNVFSGAVNEALTFLTVNPESDESVDLNFNLEKVSIDQQAEQKMIEMVNSEREKRGLSPVVKNNLLTEVGRKHCEDMFKRGYFSHYTPEGRTPFDRMAEADIVFVYAGENLAYAPNTELAMEGLMQSPGHRANILSHNFGKIGVGVINGGVYGEMFCQEFTD